MFCRNCGKEMSDKAAVCVQCGVKKGTGSSYCPNCGNETAKGAAVCLKCGVSLNGTASGEGKSRMAAGLLGILLGGLGVHNFYLGYTGKAVLQLILCLFTVGTVSSIWGLIEGIMILTGSIKKDGKGNPLV